MNRTGKISGLCLTLGALGCLLSAPARLAAQAEDAASRGLAIAQEADRRDRGFGDFTAELTMILRDRQGRESRRSLRSRTLEQDQDGDKTLVIFDEPADVKGTALLIFSHKTGDDDLWLYLPALKRVKRISASNKSGPFMGSEFAYEDLTSTEVERYTYRYLRDEDLDGSATHVVERYPADSRSGYKRQVVWIDQRTFQTLKIDFYDRKDTLLKTLTQSEYQVFEETYWRPGRLHMINHQNDKSSELLWSDYRFKTGLEERDFDRSSLARAK